MYIILRIVVIPIANLDENRSVIVPKEALRLLVEFINYVLHLLLVRKGCVFQGI